MKIKLTYFNIEGVAEPVRLALALAGQEYEDDRIEFSAWKDTKATTPYGALPLMTVDDGPVRTQSMAMLRWVGTTCSKTLYPADKLYQVEEAIGVLEDINKAWQPNLYISLRPHNYGYPEGFSKTDEGKELCKKMRQTWIKDELPKYLDRIVGLLDRADGWIVPGTSEPTIADCLAAAQLRTFTRGHVDHVDTQCLETHPKVVAYLQKFFDLPQIKGRYTNGIGSVAYSESRKRKAEGEPSSS